ncbi:MAG TPA: hypothetical protein VH643_11760 [Gemmataceae bacterium]|jgi:hypothetical protein
MAEADVKSLADILFGSGTTETDLPDVELAEAVSAWFRAWRARVRDAATFGTPAAERKKIPRRRP